MTEWEKLKVGELKEELKSRGIPLTGLKLKQQLIDKLVEVETAIKNIENQVDKDSEPDESVQPYAAVDTTAADAPNKEPHSPQQQALSNEIDTTITKTTALASPREEEVKTIRPKEGLLPTDANSTSSNEVNDSINIVQDAVLISEQDTEMKDDGDRLEEPHGLDNMEHEGGLMNTKDEIIQNSTTTLSTNETPDTTLNLGPSQLSEMTEVPTRIPTPEKLEDQRKRKRRSVSPAYNTQEIRKKVKVNGGEVAMIGRESEALEATQAATIAAGYGRSANDLDEEQMRPMEASDNPDQTRVAKDVGGLPDTSELHDPTSTNERNQGNLSHSESPEPSRFVTPAMHPATSSIYIRNFKRPLNIPTLRSHISGIAKSSSDSNLDPIKIFYLDVIRTHAFISFTTTKAASRVRNAMHESRFPDEQIREPLWVDFIPDEKVQLWIDQETGLANGGFGGGRSSGRKYEVVYKDGNDGIEAILRDLSESYVTPNFQQQRSSRMLQDQANVGDIASGVHPDRSGLVTRFARDRDHEYSVRNSQSQPLPAPSKSDSGRGFKALDELFSSTLAKPKIYYKRVPQSIVDSRLDMFRDLTMGYSDMGRSGDEGMKRYTFEEYRGQEGWVDKGPEFGFGRKGQERLEGFRGRGRNAGGFRGRGRGGDSWRGGR